MTSPLFMTAVIVLVFLVAVLPVVQADSLSEKDPFVPLDLRGVANMGFADQQAEDRQGGWTDQGGKDLSQLPLGRQVLAGVPFEIIDPSTNDGRSCLMMRGHARPYFAAEATIPVGQQFRTLYILHAGAWGPHGATYTLVYDDGTTVSKSTGSRNLGDWSQPRQLPEATLAWEGQTPIGSPAGLWMLTWANPHPDKSIRSLRVTADPDGSVTGLVAVTASTQVALAGDGNTSQRPPLVGVLWLDHWCTYTGQSITGRLTLENTASRDLDGRVELRARRGGATVLNHPVKLLNDCLETDEPVNLTFRLAHNLPIGLYDLQAVFLPADPASGQPVTIDSARLAAMGEAPPTLSGENFTSYPDPLYLMIGYVHDDARLRRDFAEMDRKGFDIVCLEWFWKMLEPEPGHYRLDRVREVIDLAEQADLKYMMYVGLWGNNPDWVTTLGDAAGEHRLSRHLDLCDPETLQRLAMLWEQLARLLRDNPTVMGYVIRLHGLPIEGAVSDTPDTRTAWTQWLKDHGYADRQAILKLYPGQAAEDVFDQKGRAHLPTMALADSPATRTLWEMSLAFREQVLLSAIERCIQAIRKHDPDTPIRLNLAQSYEVENAECPGFQQIGYYHLAEQYGCVVNQECFEFPVHAAKEPPLGGHYGVPVTVEGGAVPIGKAGIAKLFAHAIENDVAYVAYCHWLVRSHLSEWFKYKPFYKLRKSYRRVFDNLTVTSFWKGGWVGPDNWGRYIQYHHLFNRLLTRYHWEYDMVNEDLLERGKVRPGHVLLDTNSFFITSQVARDIERFVRQGGTFVANHLTDDGRVGFRTPFELQRNFFKMTIRPDQQGAITFEGQSVAGRRTGYAISPRPDDVVLAHWSDGAAAAVLRPWGEGHFLAVGFSILPDDFTSGLFDRLMHAAGVRRHLSGNADEAGLARNEAGRWFLTLLNSERDSREVTMQLRQLPPGQCYQATDLRSGRRWMVQSDPAGTVTLSIPVEGQGCNFVTLVSDGEAILSKPEP